MWEEGNVLLFRPLKSTHAKVNLVLVLVFFFFFLKKKKRKKKEKVISQKAGGRSPFSQYLYYLQTRYILVASKNRLPLSQETPLSPIIYNMSIPKQWINGYVPELGPKKCWKSWKKGKTLSFWWVILIPSLLELIGRLKLKEGKDTIILMSHTHTLCVGIDRRVPSTLIRPI